MVDRTGLGRKSLSIAKRDVFLLLSNLITGIVVARVLGPAALGVWAIFQLIVSYAESLGRLKFDQAAVFFLGARKYEAGVVAFTLHVLALASSMLLVGVLFLSFGWIYDLLFADAPDVRSLVPLVLIQIPLQFLYLNYAYLHISREDVAAYNGMAILRTVVNSGLSIAALVVLNAGLAGVVLAMLVSTTAGMLYGATVFHRHIALVRRWDWTLVREFGAYSSRLYVAGAVGQLNNQLTNLVCAVYLRPAELAIFSLAAARRDLVSILPNAASALLLSRLSAMTERLEAARLAATTARVVMVVMIAVAVSAAVLVDPAVLLLYGADYLPVAAPFRIMLLGFTLYAIATPYLQYFLAVGRPDLLVKVSVPAVLLQLTLALVLVPMWGVAGGAVSLLAALTAGSVLTLLTFLRLSTLTFREAIVIRRSDFMLLRATVTAELARYRPGRKVPSSVA